MLQCKNIEFFCIIIAQYIEQFSEKMSFSSPSQPISQQLSFQNVDRCQKSESKRKKIKKDKKARSRLHAVCHEHEIKDIQQFILQYGDAYLRDNIAEQLNRLKTLYRSQVHIKNILGSDPNVYKIDKYESCQQKGREYLELIGYMHNAKLETIGITIKDVKLLGHLSTQKRKNENGKKHNNMHLLSKTEYFLFRKRREVLKEIDDFFKNLNYKENNNIDQLDFQILALCKINASQEQSIAETFTTLSNSINIDTGMDCETSVTDDAAKNQYMRFLMMKNLKKSFDQTPIDVLNYFKIAENNERNIHDDVPLKLLSSFSQLKEYLKSRKPKPNRPQLQTLKTCCSGCFSNDYQIYNPIESCIQCGMRMHRLCQKIKGKCQRCKYLRKTVDEKSQSRCCLICHRRHEKGLMIQSFNKNGKEEFAHTFCLLVHSCWKIENEILSEDIKQDLQERFTCKFCSKVTNFGLTCASCKGSAHGMCAYLAGSSFAVDEEGKIQLSCCNQPKQQERLSFERRFKMNYHRMLYKKSSEFSNLMISA